MLGGYDIAAIVTERPPGRPRRRRLEVEFRTAALLLLLPLVGIAVVSGVGLYLSSSASQAVTNQQAREARLQTVVEDLREVEIYGLAYLADGQAEEQDQFTQRSTAVTKALSDPRSLTDSSSAQLQLVASAQRAWTAGAGGRQSLLGSRAQGAPPTDRATALEDGFLAATDPVALNLDQVQALNASELANLSRRRDLTEQATAVAVVLALLIGVLGAVLLGRRLSRSMLAPLTQLGHASERLASGDLSQRVEMTAAAELEQLGDAFNRMADQIAQRERRLLALVENATDGILVVADNNAVEFATPGFVKDFAIEKGTPLAEIVHTEDIDRLRRAWVRVIGGTLGSSVEIEARLRRRDGAWRHVWARLVNHRDDPAVAGVVINVADVSERRQHEEELTYITLHDSLSGLANRDLLQQRLEHALEERRPGGVHSLLYIDFDDFKSINDTLGHAAGDAFLISIAQRLTLSMRPQDTVARIGGDEYAVLLERTGERESVAAAERLIRALKAQLIVEGKELRPSASIGIATTVADSASPETLIADADLAMYFAKRSGKGQYRVFVPEMRTDLLDRLKLGEDLKAAVEARQLSVHYQPIVDLRAGRCVGAEALARWEHPTRGMVGPATFIPLAEEIGLVQEIDNWVLGEACRQGRAWMDAGLGELRLAVNLSVKDLDQANLVTMVDRVLRETGFPPGNLELELTEGVALGEVGEARTTLADLKELGVSLAIDDFGTGYSALSRLRTLPFDRLKVDKAFIDDLIRVDGGQGLVESILQMASVLGLEVVAEGVESADQARILIEQSCGFAQGYLFSRPVDVAAFERVLAQSAADPGWMSSKLKES
jgi:diguanylate cyclase (GGDEF)-like protein/PAS domain S-box-containing protein